MERVAGLHGLPHGPLAQERNKRFGRLVHDPHAAAEGGKQGVDGSGAASVLVVLARRLDTEQLGRPGGVREGCVVVEVMV